MTWLWVVLVVLLVVGFALAPLASAFVTGVRRGARRRSTESKGGR